MTGRIGGGDSGDAPKARGRLRSALAERLTTRTAALAGAATHIPGLFYLIALNVIIAHNAEFAGKITALVTYNAVWFALPLRRWSFASSVPPVPGRSWGGSSSGPGSITAAFCLPPRSAQVRRS